MSALVSGSTPQNMHGEVIWMPLLVKYYPQLRDDHDMRAKYAP